MGSFMPSSFNRCSALGPAGFLVFLAAPCFISIPISKSRSFVAPITTQAPVGGNQTKVLEILWYRALGLVHAGRRPQGAGHCKAAGQSKIKIETYEGMDNTFVQLFSSRVAGSIARVR